MVQYFIAANIPRTICLQKAIICPWNKYCDRDFCSHVDKTCLGFIRCNHYVFHKKIAKDNRWRCVFYDIFNCCKLSNKCSSDFITCEALERWIKCILGTLCILWHNYLLFHVIRDSCRVLNVANIKKELYKGRLSQIKNQERTWQQCRCSRWIEKIKYFWHQISQIWVKEILRRKERLRGQRRDRRTFRVWGIRRSLRTGGN